MIFIRISGIYYKTTRLSVAQDSAGLFSALREQNRWEKVNTLTSKPPFN